MYLNILLRFARLASYRYAAPWLSFCLLSGLLAASPASAITTAINNPPTISGIPNSSATINQRYSFTPSAHDADGNALIFSIRNKPTWARFSRLTGRLSGTPGAVGTSSNIVIRVSDGTTLVALPAFSITVVNGVAPTPPVISGSPSASVQVGNTYSFTPSASDANGDVLTFAIANRPTWAAFDSATGRLSGTPTIAATHSSITISVSDGTYSTALPAFAITVNAAPTNTPPVISGSPATSATVGVAYSFQPSASDANGNALTFSITNRPTWATFSTSTGRLSGTPTTAATHASIVIAVSDGIASASLPAFSIVVAPLPNSPPTISGTPIASINAGSAYTFQPTATDPDGDVLTFAIANVPVWATFNTASGRLSGTPSAGHVGTYANVTISVSDGTTTRSLPAFSIAVTQVSLGSATLSWTAPTLNTDGSPLVDLAGYRIYYGTSSGTLNQTVQLNSAGLMTYVFSNLSPATYYFAVTAFNANNVESDQSTVVSKVIN
jgi:hypothetical protein